MTRRRITKTDLLLSGFCAAVETLTLAWLTRRWWTQQWDQPVGKR